MNIRVRSCLQKIGAGLLCVGGIFIFIVSSIGNIQVIKELWVSFSKEFPTFSSALFPIYTRHWVIGLAIAIVGGLLYFAVPNEQPEVTRAEPATGKPQISLIGWGPPKEAAFPATMLRGFYLLNHGTTALEITVEQFKIGSYSAYGETLPEIAAEKEGFAPILIERKGPFFKHALDQTLEHEVDAKINRSELAYLQALKIPVSVVSEF